MTTENLRREARVDARVPVVILRAKAPPLSLVTSDVSFRGLFVETSEPAALRALVRLKVKLPVRDIEAHAMVVHVAKDGERAVGMGLQFWGLAGPERTTWDGWVRDIIQQRRASAKKLALEKSGTHPAATEPLTPSGVRVAEAPPDSDTASGAK